VPDSVAALEAARDAKSPIILQTSQGGSAYFAGKGVKDSAEKREASVAGAIAGAHYIRSIAPIYGVPVVLHTDHWSVSSYYPQVAAVRITGVFRL
jgi:fructose-bisphosphate aldolase class II